MATNKSVNSIVLATIAEYSGKKRDEIELLATREATEAAADTDAIKRSIAYVIHRVRLAPMTHDRKQQLIADLRFLTAGDPEATQAEVQMWCTLIRALPPRAVQIERDPIRLPTMPPDQLDAWSILLDLSESVTTPWCLIGGQLTTLCCIERERPLHRATTDADVVVGVWLARDGLEAVSRLLTAKDFAEERTSDGYGYRDRRSDTCIDLLLPEGVGRQRSVPRTVTGRPGFEIPGGNQALIRTEQVPIQIGDRVGWANRPNLLGALIAKAAAIRADTRETDRHREDLAVLGQLALDSAEFRAMSVMTRPRDRRRLRFALETMPSRHPSWHRIEEPESVRDALARLAVAH